LKKEGLANKYSKAATVKKRSRAKSEIPKFKGNKSRSEANSVQLISQQTNILNAWNVLKPYSTYEYSFLKASDQDYTINVLYQRPDLYQVKQHISQDYSKDDAINYAKLKS